MSIVVSVFMHSSPGAGAEGRFADLPIVGGITACCNQGNMVEIHETGRGMCAWRHGQSCSR
ncbi:hypothetical protein [Chelatococcus daeguensis]|uniref:hypothetical protein n=1 Tax=Chelatococcus daeguensis TaxID=444444 RepID=UPI0011AE1F58|nr:hypothetical protein [Chelatococcus daeguensis]